MKHARLLVLHAVLMAACRVSFAQNPSPAPMPENAPAAAAVPSSAPAPAGLDLSRFELVDLTHAFDRNTLYWPTATSGFLYDMAFAGKTEGGYYYSAGGFCTPEHGGTHLDAPVHFAEGQLAADQVPLANLIAPAVVLDIRDKVAADRDYRVTAGDVEAFEKQHGPIAAGTIVLLHTGIGRAWPDRKAVFGDDKFGDTANLHFPSYSAEAARLLVEQRKVAALGVDTPSIDYGQSKDFVVHQIAAARGVPGLENVAHLEKLPATGATVFALPMKIAGGTGGPVRIVALVPKK